MMKTNEELAFFMGRIAFGVNFFFHGLTRLDKLPAFAEGISKGFENTMFPVELARAYGFIIPLFELIAGLMIVLGIFTRYTLFASGLFMATLIAGMCLQEQWNTVGTQMVYVIMIFLLLQYEKHNTWVLKS